MKVLMDGVISAAGFQSRDIMFNLPITVQHHTIIPIVVKMPKAELGPYSNFGTTLIGVNAVYRLHDTFDTKHDMIYREQCLGKTL